MSEFKPEQGDMILVLSVIDAWVEREFIAMHHGRYVCVDIYDRDNVCLWKDAKPLPTKPEPIPFTHETWPKQVVWVRSVDSDRMPRMVVGLELDGVVAGRTRYLFKWMSGVIEMSLDFCQTWQPCHYVKESN